MVFKIERGETVQCEELSTGKRLAATFRYDDNGIRTQIFSLSDSFYVRGETPIFLATEKLSVVSLYENITAPPARSSSTVPPRAAHRQDVISNIAVCGPDEWRPDDNVRRVSFFVSHTDSLLRHNPSYDRLQAKKWPDDADFNILSEQIGDTKIEVNYCATYNSMRHGPERTWAEISMEFSSGLSLDDYVDQVKCIVFFLSFCMGARLAPKDISISRLTRADLIRRIENDEDHVQNHEVIYIWPDIELDERDLWIGGSLVHCGDDEERAAFCQTLRAWFERQGAWDKANNLMMVSMKMQREISPNRLINACKWFEDIPLTSVEMAIKSGDVPKIAEAAAMKAAELGYPSIASRVAGLVKSIKTETSESRFQRLVRKVTDRFGTRGFEGLVEDLQQAVSFRGRIAHSHFKPADDSEHQAFLRSIYAMEALCFLLTALELPSSMTGLDRVKHNPLVQQYLLARR